ncbi:MAG: VWA domain-containing protein [Verrucomicrobia bacterium]|jgi:hypothetical protein|nr:VWA domain-containing protein [Verrucomicrobiota bacterium]MBT7066898.1 VWA domain-containing protein [Verrucomicrobiota bacterium]MBT7700957.1 VWA domain-containing protein [Verrucomicrobiota bacterium]
MFDLLNPMFFTVMGSIGVLVPLVLHLIQSRRTVKLPFSTVRFLHLAQERSSSRIKMENILLWIIRTCLLVILALAFAMPMLRGKGRDTIFGRAPRDVALVIDGSYSMAYNLGRRTVWESAVDTAVAIIEGLGEQDRLCVFVAREHVEPMIEQLSGDRDAAISRLKALTIAPTSSELAPAVAQANQALADSETRREREIHVITDGQGLPWDSFAAVTGLWDPATVDQERTTVFVSLLGAETPENLAPLLLEVDPPLLLASTAARATVRLGLSGPMRATTVTLTIDGVEVATQSITVDNDQAAERVFSMPPLTPGWHTARVVTPDDNLPIDNAFDVILHVEEHFPALCVGSRDDTLFIRAALKAGQGGGIAVDWVEPGRISEESLARYACIFLCNAIPLSGGEVSALERFVDAGGLLVIFPGGAAAVGDYQSWSCLPALPSGIVPLGVAARKAMLHGDGARHALLAGLRMDESPLSIVVRKRLAWDRLEARAEPILSHGEAPFLAGRPVGRGYVLLFAASADRSWTDFPLSPIYLPIVHQIVAYGAGIGAHPPFVWCADHLPLSHTLPAARHDSQIEAPDGRPVPVRSAVVGGATVLHLETIDQAGIYRMTPPAGGTPVPALAVNIRRDESNLAPLDETVLRERLALDDVVVARDRETLETAIRERRVGRTFGEQLLWLVLILAALEFLVANRQAQETPTLSSTLGVDASGKVPAASAGGRSA